MTKKKEKSNGAGKGRSLEPIQRRPRGRPRKRQRAPASKMAGKKKQKKTEVSSSLLNEANELKRDVPQKEAVQPFEAQTSAVGNITESFAGLSARYSHLRHKGIVDFLRMGFRIVEAFGKQLEHKSGNEQNCDKVSPPEDVVPHACASSICRKGQTSSKEGDHAAEGKQEYGQQSSSRSSSKLIEDSGVSEGMPGMICYSHLNDNSDDSASDASTITAPLYIYSGSIDRD